MADHEKDPTVTGRVGALDRAARLVLSVVFLGFALFCPFAQSLGAFVVWASGVIGAVLLATALLGRCPLYRLMRIRS